MDIVATDIGELLFVGLLVATIAVVPLFIWHGIRAALRKPKTRLAEPIFTPEQATRYIQLKYRYETTEEVNR